jgi:hypothetical protein
MTSGHAGPARVVRPVLPVLLAAVLLAGCGSSSGVHTQTPATDSPPSTSASPTPSTSATTSTSTSSRTKSASGIPTPTASAPAAQGAVNAYIALANAYNHASADPAHADLTTINKYLSGKALALFDQSIASMKAAGQAYRGTPGNPNVKVQRVFSSSSVFLTSCPTDNPNDPFVEYYVGTGKPVPVAKRNPPPPYSLTLPMQLVGSQWKLTDLLQDVGKTCS